MYVAEPDPELDAFVYTPVCSADLGDARCGVDLTAFEESGTVAAVSNATTFRGDSPREEVGFV